MSDNTGAGAEPMTEERLAQIADLSPFPFDHPATRIVVDTVRELVAEVTRLRTVEAELRGHLEAIGVAHREGAMAGQQVSETLKWHVETAERELAETRATARDLIGENDELRAELIKVGEELAEMRERIGEAEVQWGVWMAASRYVSGSDNEANARALAGFTGRDRVKWRVVGEWKAADDEA